MGSCLRTQCQPFYSCSAFKQLKQPSKWVPRELTENQNNHFEVSSSLTLSNNNKSHEPMVTLSSTKEARIYNRKKTASLTSGVRKTGQPLVKE